MAKRVLDYEPSTGVTTTFDYDYSTDTTVIGTEQSVELLLDNNKLLANDSSYTKQGIKNEWWHYASIPLIVVEKWRNEFGIDVFNKDHLRAVFKKLNDPEYKYLKTTSLFHQPK